MKRHMPDLLLQHIGRGLVVTRSVRQSPLVLLTRELGKNEKLQTALAQHGLTSCMELPLIEHSDGPDRKSLPSILGSQTFDWITVTSPEAASVFIEAWEEAGKPSVRIAVVGGGTGEILEAGGVQVAYTATKSTAKVMGSELPKHPGGNNTVLYPASAKASTDLQDSLATSGFTVTRLDTYNTSGVKSVPPDQLQAAKEAEIITFGSPSAVKAWVSLVGLDLASKQLSVCIGSTSFKACQAAGLPLEKIYYPESPGVKGWAESVIQACRENRLHLTS